MAFCVWKHRRGTIFCIVMRGCIFATTIQKLPTVQPVTLLLITVLSCSYSTVVKFLTGKLKDNNSVFSLFYCYLFVCAFSKNFSVRCVAVCILPTVLLYRLAHHTSSRQSIMVLLDKKLSYVRTKKALLLYV